MYCPSKNTGRVSLISFVALLAVALCLFAFAPTVALAQSSNTGIVSGTVVDPSNAIVPGANVSLVNTATLATRSTLSNKEGQYVFAFVDPGNYSIKVSKAGFKTTVVANQVVKVGLQLTANVTLQVGSTSTTVEVTSTPGSELQTLTPTVGATLSGAVILNLPNTSRDASTLAVLQPGQNINGATGGAETDQNSFQIDGGFATDDMSGDNNTYIRSFGSDTAGGAGAMHSQGFNQAPSAVIPMPVSTIQEFKVSTSNQTADFNGGAGSQVQVLTKKGTNQFHGSGYEYYEDNNFGGANTWDNNSNGIRQPGSHFSRFGVDAGGKIPGLNILGGGWYIFGGYEGFRFPASAIFKRAFPTASLRAGLIKFKGASGAVEVVNLNTVAIQDPALAGVAGGGPSFAPNTGTIVAADGTTLTADPCGGGPCDPLNLGVNPVIQNLWNDPAHGLPLPNDFTAGSDGFINGNALYTSKALDANVARFDGPIATPQTSNFEVFRIDHDFAKNEHFNGTYHYYKLKNTVSDQWDVGGFFPGDTQGQYSAIRQKPQVPWVYTAGLTTDINANMTNSFTFSYTRNWWAYGDPSGVPNVAGFPAALEMGGETSSSLQPYNTNNQSVRTRYWNGHDSLYRDDITWIKGNHLFQFGGSYLRANDTHNRNDNGESINTFEQYVIGEGTGSSLSGFGISGMGPGEAFVPASLSSSNTKKYGDYYSMLLGMVDSTQSLFSRGLGNLVTGLPLNKPQSCAIASVPSTSACVNFPSLTNNSIIPTYNVYFTDSWHLKPTFSLNYGIGYTIEMPPFETQGGFQTVMVDGTDHILSAEQYLNNEKNAALQGLPYAPMLGFATVRNVQQHSKYPYDPFYGGISPRIGFAWNFRPDTVVRGGYARIFGRVNGVNPILVPMLTPGLLQPVTCGGPNFKTGQCGGDPTNLFRVGVNGVNAPLPPPSANLPQPWFPGLNDVATGSGETFDPNFHPDRSDEFTLSVQHQFGPKILAEVGYIGRKIGNEIQYYSLTNVPYMMTQGGQTFANAWRNIMVATNYGFDLTNIPTQQFFETGLNPAYCNGSLATGLFTGAASCTEAFVQNNAGNMQFSDPFDSWTAVSGIGGFNFGRSITSDPIAATSTITNGVCSGIGCNGQSPSILTTVSNGYGNYNAGYLQLTFTDWHGLTMKTNFSMSNALGTGNVVQASSSFSSVDDFNLRNNYGPQIYNEKFVFNLFLNYASPYYASQQGIIGHLLGGWSISPLFVWGSGFPLEVSPPNEGNFGACGTFGECNENGPVSALENGIITQNLHYTATRKTPTTNVICGTSGSLNVFSNVDANCPGTDPTNPDFLSGNGIFGEPFRAPILGLDGQIGGGGPLYGLSFWNLDLGINKKIKIMERLSSTFYFDFANVANHMQPADPCFFMGDQADWGVLGCGGNTQGNTPRRLQLGISFDW